MCTERSYRVKQVAELSGVSVRTLHHYDAIGLLVPSMRSAAGYRLYGDDDLFRLQQVLIGRALGWSLEAIRRSLDDPGFDRRHALLEQRAELKRRAADTAAMLRSVDAALAALASTAEPRGEAAQPSPIQEEWNVEMKKLFDGFNPDEHADEARQRWGHTEAYRVSQERVRSYKEADWRAMRDEAAAIYAAACAVLEAGKAPDTPEAMDVAERHRLHIERWFYPCSASMHCGLADLYETDQRFAKNIDRYREGLTPFLSATIRANARRAGAAHGSGAQGTPT